MNENNRKVFTSAQKANVALAAVSRKKTIHQIAEEYRVHPTQVNRWKKELMINASSLFETKRGPKPAHESRASDVDHL